MLENISKLNLVRIGSYITYSSLKKIGNELLESTEAGGKYEFLIKKA